MCGVWHGGDVGKGVMMPWFGIVSVVAAVLGPALQVAGNLPWVTSGPVVWVGFLAGIVGAAVGAVGVGRREGVTAWVGMVLCLAGLALPFVLALLFG